MKTYLQLLEESLPDREHPRYAIWRAYALSGEERAMPIINKIQESIVLTSAKVLDLGCGDGGLTVALKQVGAKVVALDLDLSSTIRTKARLSEKNFPATVTNASADALPIASNNLDVVIIQDLIEHVSNPIRVLMEANRVLKVGGFCQLSVVNRIARTNILSDPHWGLAGVILMPRWLATWYVCKIRRRAQYYNVWYIPTHQKLLKWLKTTNFTICNEESTSCNQFFNFSSSVLSIICFKTF
jgi:ubiquinone/menaquinone biosynthesis C-methylase UbiE